MHKTRTIKGFLLLAGAVLSLSIVIIFISCNKSKNNPVIIWTSCADFASYVELFNATQNKAKAVVVYKEQPARSLPPTKDENPPDIIIGSWLKNSTTRRYFTPIDYLFSDQKINKSLFYPQLLEYGNINDKQYLLPVSFNLPAIIFSTTNNQLITNEHSITLNDIRTIAGNFNEKNNKDVYIKMGFAPSWDFDFLYLMTKLNNVSYREKGTSFSWDSRAMLTTTTLIKEWTTARNTNTTSEQDFQFKYLYMPEYKQVSTGRCLFAYMPSDKIFSLSSEQQSGLTFRWIEQNGKIPVADEIITMGLYKKAQHNSDAEVFLSWFNKITTQEALLSRTSNMKLNNKIFGIAGGFSALISINENTYPSYYRQLQGNIPSNEFLITPNILPYRWPSLKNSVVIPYLIENTNTDFTGHKQTLEERIAEWSKQYF